MTLTALQLASFVADLEDFFTHESQVLDDLREKVEGGGDFEEGLVVGGTALQNIFEVERDIDLALYRLEKALRPLELDESIKSIRRRDLFRICRDNSFAESLYESFAVLQWRRAEMAALRNHLLGLGEKELRQAYSEKLDAEFTARWEEGLAGLLQRGDV